VSNAAKSILVYAVYLFGEGAALLVAPNFMLGLFGLPPSTDVWIRIVGMTVVFFGVYYVIAARYEFRPFFVASIATRSSVPFIFAIFVIAGLAPLSLMLFTPVDILFVAWTWLALRQGSVPARASAG
jgi:hypothetical protein